MARTIVRRAEREVVRLIGEEAVTPALLRYLNRLSDHLFVLARVLNSNGANDVLWSPGQNLTEIGAPILPDAAPGARRDGVLSIRQARDTADRA